MIQITIAHPGEVNVFMLWKFLNEYYEKMRNYYPVAYKLRNNIFTEPFCGN